LIGTDGSPIGVVTFEQALRTADDQDLDLVLIAPQAQPPVCRIMDYGKFRFERDKREKEAKKKQQVMEVKEIQLSCRIDTNDFNTKLNHARRFLSACNKVKVIVKFKGRQLSHTDIGAQLLEKFQAECAEFGTVDKKPVMEGRFLSMMIAPLKQK
jgi:translation initiation factor IF-3